MTAPRLFHFANIFVLFSWSGVMLYFYASGRVDNILTESFRIAPLLGGLGLAVVGFFNLLTPRTQACCGHEHTHAPAGAGHHDHGEHAHHQHAHHQHAAHDHAAHGHDHDDHHSSHDHAAHDHSSHDHAAHDHAAHDHAAHHHAAHDHSSHDHAAHDHAHHEHSHEVGHTHDDQSVTGILVTLLIVLVPAIGGAALCQDKFSVQTLANKGLYSNEVASPAKSSREKSGKGEAADDEDRYTLADLEKQVRKSEEGHFLIPIPSLFYSAADEELADVLQGLPIETTGQVAPEIAENDPQGTRLRLYRLFISCCLADARPIGFSADFGKTPPQFPEDSWVKIVGKMHYPEKDGRRVPVITVNEIETIPEPEDQMY